MAYKYIINNKKVSAHSKQTLFPNEIDKIMIFFAKRKLKILSYLCDLDHFWKTNAYLSQKCLNISKIFVHNMEHTLQFPKRGCS